MKLFKVRQRFIVAKHAVKVVVPVVRYGELMSLKQGLIQREQVGYMSWLWVRHAERVPNQSA